MKLNGLSKSEVEINREKYGINILTKTKKDSFLKKLLITFSDPIIKILLIALALKVIVLFQNFDWYETIGIVLAILFASLISTISEYGSEKAFEKLQEDAETLKCKVIRDGKKQEIDCKDIVCNDLICLEQGDKIPADAIIIKGNLQVDESSLNGETKEVTKKACLNINNPKDNNIVYMGTVVYNGTSLAIVSKVGNDTYYGKLSLELQKKQPDTPLKIRLRQLANFISKIGYIGAILVFISYLFSVVVIKNNFEVSLIKETIFNFPLISSYILYAFTLCVTIIIVAVPEGLPMMITLVLSSNMKRMLKSNVLVRKLVGIETSGNINILFTDKTGTLTKGKLEVVNIILGNLKSYSREDDLKRDKNYELIKISSVVNNSSSYSKNEIIGGNITDRALLRFFKEEDLKYEKIKTIPFSSENKYSITTINKEGKNINLIKGAPEVLLKNCKRYYNNGTTLDLNKEKIKKVIEEETEKGIRVIMLAISSSFNPEDFNDLIFLGLVLIKDEIRKEAIEGVKLVSSANINTVMITGDNKSTAISVAKEVGILKSNGIAITSDELNKMTDQELTTILPNLKVVARSLPNDKSRLIRVSQEAGYVVGMTGDGVNDAPALNMADVGFSMGSGTEVAKEASDIVIIDDNFLSISKAILYGRTIFKSIRKFIIVQLTINMCALGISIIGPFIGIEMPITVIQMLWINMVMDTLAGLAFSFEPALIEYMEEESKEKDEPIINKYMINQIFFTGFYSSLLCVLFLKCKLISSLFRSNNHLYTAFFGLFIFIDIFNSFNARTHRINIFANIIKNKMFILIISLIVIIQIFLIYYGGSLFRTSGLNLYEFFIMILLAFTVVPIDWLRKFYLRKKGIKDGV